MDEVQNLICFIRQCEVEVIVFFNEEGQFYRGKDNTVYLTQATIEKWQRSRGLKVTKQALKDTVKRLQLAGLEIEEPASKRFDDEVVWAAATKLNRITTTYDEPLTTNYTELTEIYRHKNNINKENVSAKQPVTP